MIDAALVALLALLALDPPAAPPEPPPIPTTPSAQPTPTPTPTPEAPPTGQSSAEPTAPGADQAPARRLWIILDYYKEFGGTVVREDEASIVLRTPAGEERVVDRNAIVSAVPLLDDREGTRVVVRWRNGRSLPGELVSDGFDEIVVRLNGVRTSLPRRQIHCLERETPFEEQLARFRARIPADAWDVRLELVHWLLAQQHPEIAVEELREIRKHADSEEAARLLVRAEAEWELARKTSERRAPAQGDPKAAANPGRPSISEDDVNLIRVMEVDLKAPPRMHHLRELPGTILERYGNHERMPNDPQERAQIPTWSTARLLQLLFALKARELYPMIRVDEDPEHLRAFRKRVHDGWLIPNCATSRCHGGPGGGPLVFATDESRTPRTAYTNLLVLLAHRTEKGEALVDFDAPERSILMGFGRPRESAPAPHPAVAGWKPVAASLQRAMEDDAAAWVRGMHRPRHDYPVQVPPARASEEPPETAEPR